MSVRTVAGLGLALALEATRLMAATYTVTNTNDSGAGSLRQAILDANGNPGTDTIAFDIPGAGVHTISPASGLPEITDPVVIDGYTQPGSSPNAAASADQAVLLIELDGTNVPGGAALVLAGGSSTVRGLVVNRWANSGIVVYSDHNVIEGNFVGTDASGLAALPNGGSGNGGVIIAFGAGGNDNTVGGTTPDARNLISGNLGSGVLVGAYSGNVIEGNFVGVDATGAAALGNSGAGVSINGTGNTLGGASAAARNVISGNNRGVQFNGSGHVMQGNFVGTDADGLFAVPNLNEGVNVNVTTGVVIGGVAPTPGTPPGNVISGNVGPGLDIYADSTGTQVQGNIFGADVNGINPIPNSLSGVTVNGHGNSIGDVAPGAGNLIVFNGSDPSNGGSGVEVENNVGFIDNSIRGNSFFGNERLGIDLRQPADGTGGVTPNDPLDPDTGANALQNFPIIQSVNHPNDSTTDVLGKLDSMPSTDYTLDFYADVACSNRPREFLQGRTYLGSAPVSTDGSGHVAFAVPLPVGTEAGARISATATDPDGNTSEISQRIIFSVDVRSGPPAGGTAITVSGTNFVDGTTLMFGGVAASATFVNDHTLTTASPALSPGTVYDIVAQTPDGTTGTLTMGWVSDFLDVPGTQQFYGYVTTLVSNGITVGVGGGNYGVDAPTLRQQMAVFILKAKHGLCYTPPACIGMFGDVPCTSNFAPWIEAMATEGITGGCGGGNFCPTNPVRRDQMAVFLLKGEHGSSYVPPACQGIFGDVACPSTFADWIEQLSAESITGGCGGGNYCPANANTRGQMAVFLTKTFRLQ